MRQLYAKPPSDEGKNLKPKKETIQFLLNYSKALNTFSVKNLMFQNVLN